MLNGLTDAAPPPVVVVDRPPRIQPDLPVGRVKIPPPPHKDNQGMRRLLQLALPLLTIIGFASLSLSAGGSRGPLTVIIMSVAVLGATGLSLFTFLQDKRKEAALERAYATRLVGLNRDMQLSHDQQRRFYAYNYPDIDSAIAFPSIARNEATRSDRPLRAPTRLWERRTDDQDFGVIRLGMGTQPSSVIYELEQAEASTEDTLTRNALKLQEDSKFVRDVPVGVSLRPAAKEATPSEDTREDAETAAEHAVGTTPHAHAIGVAGDRDAVYHFVRSALAHYVVFHAPMDAKLFVLSHATPEWEWTERLPHCTGAENQQLVLLLDQTGPGAASNTARVTKFLEGLRKQLTQRQMRLRDSDARARGDDPTLPFYLIVVDLLDAAPGSTSPLAELESDAAISLVLKQGASVGAAIMFLTRDRSRIPSDCTALVEIESTAPPTNRSSREAPSIHFRFAQTGINSFRYFGNADLIDSAEIMRGLANELAALQVRRAFGADLPDRVPFLTLTGCESLAELTALARSNWESSKKAQEADHLRATVGLVSGGKPRTLVFSARDDGVHGMIAGSTGSGKSELLIALIVMLAIRYDPSALNFVLVDFKGGGAFGDFVDLPHCVDVITNLAISGVMRMFSAIQAELRRRQKLLSDSGTSSILEYRQKRMHEARPFPFLFIVIDEFAELMATRPEFKAELESITRVGRTLGVSLVLAAQRPSGVTDQMRSNIKLRISLRVETEADSREILRRTDAAYLPGSIPGRGFVQIGTDEIEAIQVAYAGDPYVDPTYRPKVLWPDRIGRQSGRDHDRKPLYRAIIESLTTLANDQRVPKQPAPWPAPLPAQLALTDWLLSSVPDAKPLTAERYLDAESLDTILLGQRRDPGVSLNPALNRWMHEGRGWVEPLEWERHAFRPVIGLLDNPTAARQAPVSVELVRGHAAVFGASGWGKTTFVRTLVVSLAATHSPAAARVYILDLGGHNLSALAHLPHVEAIISPDDENYQEQVEQLLRELEDTLSARKLTLSTSGLSDMRAYNAAHPDQPVPGLVFIVDNFVEFKETFGKSRDNNVDSILDRFVALARECRPYGIYLVVTAGQVTALPTQAFNLFTERFAFRLSDATDYRGVVGGAVDSAPDLPGRGYVSSERQPLLFQLATPLDSGAANETADLERLAESMHEFIRTEGLEYVPALTVGALPKSVLYRHMLANQLGWPLDETLGQRLHDHMEQTWKRNLTREHAAWLEAPIGMLPGSRGTRTLHFEAKQDGAHGLIAGGTGSGKSELLMAMIVGLAINYSPEILTFVLVDYKGGGTFKPFEDLPHTVDLVTNLNKSGVHRMFTAIMAEIERRQDLNARTGTKDIVEYRQRGLHLNGGEPYPHLFVIIDEYAEMISDSPEFKAVLESITRTGRAQGVVLILASQRPTGVTDQMYANIKLHMCLRVEDAATSREVLRRSDAAGLPNMPGRGYLQVGNDNIELIQFAWTGDTSTDLLPTDDGSTPKFFDVVVNLARQLAPVAPLSPWPRVLPTDLTLSDALEPEYVGPGFAHLMTPTTPPMVILNPALERWMTGNGEWPGVDWDTRAMRAVVGRVDDPYHALQPPLVIDFSKGHAVLFGASGWGKTTFVRTVITSLAATHSPWEFQAHVLDLGGRVLESLRELPHVGTVISPDERGYEERVQQLLRRLDEEVESRKKDFSAAHVTTLYEYNAAHPEAVKPGILVAIDNIAEYLDTFADKRASPDSMIDALVGMLRQGKSYGVHFLVTAGGFGTMSNKMYSLFTERLTLRLSNSDDYASVVGNRMTDVDEIAGRGYVRERHMPLSFQVALTGLRGPNGVLKGETEQVIALGRAMREQVPASASAVAAFRIDALPNSVSYRDMLSDRFHFQADGSFIAQLKSAIGAQWERQLATENPEWLRVEIGKTSGGGSRDLRLEARHDGVHGLVAGGTGSGKSELLLTLIVGLTVNYPPTLLNFVLVDYKGGGTFKPLEGLPHIVDLVTNLDKSRVDRMFKSISAEIQRRQKLNRDTNTNDIIDYRRRGLHRKGESYPHLFVIIDEYAEMISDNPDYKEKLESLTRVGRAQGVNLLLASQRPMGVSDQMRANMKLRLCLRVEGIDTSIEMLRRADAAFLPGLPGRGYLQGGNESLELLQVAYTGERQEDDRPPAVRWPDRPAPEAVDTSEARANLNTAMVLVTSELEHGEVARKPWPAFLPDQLSLQSWIYDAQAKRRFTLMTGTGTRPEPDVVTDWLNDETDALWPRVDWQRGAMQAVVGLLDNPATARQERLRLDLRQHLAVFGDTGWGKTSFLRTLMVSLAATHSPADLHMYVLDLGGRNFRSLEAFPHCGGVIYADDETFEERMQRLLERLTDLIEERQGVFAASGVTGFYDYNQRFPETALPAVLVVIDNVIILQENYQALVDNTIIPLVRRSAASGVTFAISANGPSGLHRLGPLFGTQITFRQNKPEVYLDIVGRGAVELGDIPGRGYIRLDRRPLEFQAALPVGLFDHPTGDPRSEADELGRMAAAMQTAWSARASTAHAARPESIDVLETWALATLLAAAPPPRAGRIEAVLGVGNDLKPALVDLKRQAPHFSVTGPARSGRTTVLYNWVLSLADRYSPDRVALLLVDLQRKFVTYGGQHRLDELPHVKSVAFDLDELERSVATLKDMVTTLADSEPSREIFVIIDSFDDAAAELESTAAAKEMGVLVRRNGHLGLHCVVVGGRGASAFDLQRRIRQAGYGVGLRTAEAVSALDASRTPAGLRSGAELAVGRGYLVRAGQTLLIQMANPFIEIQSPSPNGHVRTDEPAGDDEREGELAAAALDAWVERIKAKYPHPSSDWNIAAGPTDAPPVVNAPPNPRVRDLAVLVRSLAQRELVLVKSDTPAEPVLLARLADFDAESWNSEAALVGCIRAVLVQMQNGMTLSETWDTESVVLAVKNQLEREEKNAVAP